MSSEVSTRSIIVVSLVAGDGMRLVIVFLTWSFLTIASACVLRMLRSRSDLAFVDTVLLVGVVDMKSAAEDEGAMMNGFVCPGESARNIRVVFLLRSSFRLIGLWLISNILLSFSAASLAFVNFVFAVFCC